MPKPHTDRERRSLDEIIILKRNQTGGGGGGGGGWRRNWEAFNFFWMEYGGP